jgi:hypothetical protein
MNSCIIIYVVPAIGAFQPKSVYELMLKHIMNMR